MTSVMAGRMDRMILTTLRLPARLEAALTKHTVANLRVQRRAAPGAAPTVHDLVATQMDRSYATAHRVMREARHRLPSYTPRRVLDFGAGQSPMAWAAQASWPNVQLQVCALTLTPTLTLTVTLTLALTLAITLIITLALALALALTLTLTRAAAGLCRRAERRAATGRRAAVRGREHGAGWG